MPFKPSGVASNQVALVTIRVLEPRRPCSFCVCVLDSWSGNELVPAGVKFQCICLQKDPSAFWQWPGCSLIPASLSQRKLIPNTYFFHWGLRRKMEFWFILWSLVNLRSLMWSLSNLQDPGGNTFTMPVTILQNTWILNTVIFHYKWWLFFSCLWSGFVPVIQLPNFVRGGIIRGFCTNVFLSVLFWKNEGREFWEIGGNWSRRPHLPLFLVNK